MPVIEPIRISFEVACDPAHAFRTWTQRTSAWWPAQHTLSHESGADIVFEPSPGGRIFERTASGQEIPWGEIIVWEPPRRLSYLWHIATDPDDATEVSIVFIPLEGARTRIEIEHGGWDRLAERGQPWRDANRAGWDGVLPAFVAAASRLQTT